MNATTLKLEEGLKVDPFQSSHADRVAHVFGLKIKKEPPNQRLQLCFEAVLGALEEVEKDKIAAIRDLLLPLTDS